MNIAVIYDSRHHGNTKRVLDALSTQARLTLIPAATVPAPSLEDYDVIGFASGIYYSKFHKCVLQCAERSLPEGKNVFFVYTCGVEKQGYTDAISAIVRKKGGTVLGTYGCLGFNTFGPFKLIGGIAKGHPSPEDLDAAVQWFQETVL